MIKKKQHFVPQCYLRNFTNDNGLFVLDKIKQTIYSAKVGDIAQGNYFYDFPTAFLPQDLQGKQENQIIEDDLSKVELNFSKLIKEIIDCLKKIENENLFDSVCILDEKAKINFSVILLE
jgi:hypothetical protein